MKISLSMTDIQELFEEFQQTTRANRIIDDFDEQLQLPEKIGKGYIRNWHLQQGLELYLEAYECQENVVFESSVQHPFLKLGFCISGNVHGLEPGFVLSSGQTLLLTRNTDIEARTEVFANHPICVVEIVIPPHLLNNLLSEELLPSEIKQMAAGMAPSLYAQAGTTTPAMAIALHQILHCPYQGFTKQLYLESKTLELITLRFAGQPGDIPKPEDTQQLRLDEVERIYVARDLLICNLDSPPSLIMLARQVGLNDYKLKLGFRQVFGTTVFGYLHNHRMEQARQLLQADRLSIEAVSQAVGYASLSSFYRAFKKQFGVNPRACKSSKSV